MSEWVYRDCPKCGDRIHINFFCDCGGDPWDVLADIEVLSENINLLNRRFDFQSGKAINARERWGKEVETLFSSIDKQKRMIPDLVWEKIEDGFFTAAVPIFGLEYAAADCDTDKWDVWLMLRGKPELIPIFRGSNCKSLEDCKRQAQDHFEQEVSVIVKSVNIKNKEKNI